MENFKIVVLTKIVSDLGEVDHLSALMLLLMLGSFRSFPVVYIQLYEALNLVTGRKL